MSSSQQALSVSQAMQLAKSQLEGINVRIMGEVSELAEKPGYKAVYFSIKDGSATLPCLMWMNVYRASGVPLRLGALVEISGRFSLYAAKGRMNFEARTLNLAGEGQLRLQVAQLAERLKQEGLVQAERKRPIPLYPEHIGLVTSPRGAAVHDVLRTLRRRFPLAHVYLSGVTVEGPSAAQELARGIHACVQAGAQVVLLVRGGGSYEDLMPFNDEMLARTIAACPVPVVTGIGHEHDNSIADMVSDLRVSTPTAAAERVSVSQYDLLDYLQQCAERMQAVLSNQIALEERVLTSFQSRPLFADTQALFASAAQGLDMAQLKFEALSRDFNRLWKAPVQEQAHRLKSALPFALAKDRQALTLLGKSLEQSLPRLAESSQRAYQERSARISHLLQRGFAQETRALEQMDYRTHQLAARLFAHEEQGLVSCTQSLRALGAQMLEKPQAKLSLCVARLHDVSPLTILARGYSFTQDKAGTIIKSVNDCNIGSKIIINFQDGRAQAQIESVTPNSETTRSKE